MRRLPGASALLVIVLCPFFSARLVAQAGGEDAIRAGYERLYQGNAGAAQQYFAELARKAPENLAAQFGLATALFARIEFGASLDKEFESCIDQVIQKAQERYSQDRRSHEALLYLAQAYELRANYRFSFNKGVWGAARDGSKSKGFSDEYFKTGGTAADADFALGTYNYYVEIAPSFVKVFRALLFLPAGNRQAGLKQLEHAARDGKLWGPQAQYMLTEIYGWLEGRPEEAVRLALDLQQRYPDNDDYQMRVANLYSGTTLEDYEKAASQFQAMIERSTTPAQAKRRYSALLGLASVRRQQWRVEDAIAGLSPTIAEAPSNPDWVLPRFLLSRGVYRATLNDPKALEDLRRVLSQPQWKRFHTAAERQIRMHEERQKSGEAAVAAALIPANRLLAERRWDEARQGYEKVRQQYRDDWQVRFRLANLDFQRGNLDDAGAGFAQISDTRAKMPPWIKANSLLQLARIADLRNQRDQAVKLYKKVIDDYEHEGAAQAARQGLVTPYHRPTVSVAAGSAAAHESTQHPR